MKLRLRISALVLSIATVFVACTDTSVNAPSSRAPQMSGDLLGSTLSSTLNTVNSLLLSCTPMDPVVVTKTFGPNGGTMKIGPHTFTVPANALPANTTITATTYRENVNRVDFAPEGLTFSKPASLTLSYANCNTLGSLLPKHIAYTTDNLKTILDLLPSIDNLSKKTVTSPIEHFSDYVMAW